MRVFLVYDQIIKKNIPLQNASEMPEKSYFYRQLNRRNIKTTPILTKSLRQVNPCDLYIYPIEPIGKMLSTFISSIPSDTIKRLTKLKCPILTVYPTEGFSITAYDHWLDHLQYYFFQKGWQGIPKYFLSGNISVADAYNQHRINIDKKTFDVPYRHIFEIDEASKFSKVYGVNYFEYQTKIDIDHKQRAKVAASISFDQAANSNRTVDFLNYNRHPRSHRIALVAELIRQNLVDNAYYSLVGSDSFNPGENCLEGAKKYFCADSKHTVGDFFRQWKGINIEFEQSSVNDIFSSDARHYLDTFFSLVSETEVHNDSLYLTEKTFKPIINYHPFIIWGTPRSLEFLRSRGYQTFPEFFCEDYDQEFDDVKRFKMIIDQVKNFISLDLQTKKTKYMSVLDKLKHNYDNFYSRPDEYKSSMEKIFSDIYLDQRK
jgi:hypothetical protein